MRAEGKYILDAEGNVVIENDIIRWGRWMEENQTGIAKTIFNNIKVSTIFLGVDYGSYHTPKNPLLFETMVFDDNEIKSNFDGFQDRYHTKKEALRGHRKICKMLFTDEEIKLANLRK